eukprot:TRINITY_DN237_c0_g1_i1.p1 TRINITY_DN237_c0_g1~~TRINITY_DN237_c0_g1_i1.p1  ORF type:complete len:211 (-),score=91.83 TRINITY_DN237_c0_g1_i1:12-644(-)
MAKEKQEKKRKAEEEEEAPMEVEEEVEEKPKKKKTQKASEEAEEKPKKKTKATPAEEAAETEAPKPSKKSTKKKSKTEDKESEPIAPPDPVICITPVAHPMASDKLQVKILKAIKAAAQEDKKNLIKQGVKEVVKAIRKGNKPGVVVFGANITPVDVISHIPVLCEEKNIPYVFVQTKEELGKAIGHSRPTSVVMFSNDGVIADVKKLHQ